MLADVPYWTVLIIPVMVIPSTAIAFGLLSKWLGKERGYLLGFMFYWTIWCLIAL